MPFLQSIILVSMFSSAVGSDRVPFVHVSEALGASRTEVRAIHQDPRGFLWLATREGLDRFDGHSLLSYRHEPFDEGSLSSGSATHIVEGTDGSLWVIAGGVVNLFDRATERFSHPPLPTVTTAGAQPYAHLLIRDSRDRIWVGTWRHGLYRFDRERNRFTAYRADPDRAGALDSDEIRVLVETSRGRLWVGTATGLFHMHVDGSGFQRFTPPANVDAKPHTRVRSWNRPLAEDSAGNVWVATEDGGLAEWDGITGEITHHARSRVGGGSPGAAPIETIHIDGEDRIWLISTAGELLRFARDQGIYALIRPEPERAEGLPDVDFRGAVMEEDPGGNLWIGTREDGLIYFSARLGGFTHARHDPDDPSSLAGDAVRSLLVDRTGNLWVGTALAGLDQHSPYRFAFEPTPGPDQSRARLGKVSVRAALADRMGDLWLGTFRQGLVRLEAASGGIRKIYTPGTDPPIAHLRVSTLAEANDGSLWIGTGSGLTRLSADRATSRIYPIVTDEDTPRWRNAVTSVLIDSREVVWIGTRGGVLYLLADPENGDLWIGHAGRGLYRFDPTSGLERIYRHDPADRAGLSHASVSCLFRDRAGDLWVGTLGGGLNRMTADGNGFTHVTRRQGGLPGNLVYAIEEDALGRLWVSLESGLVRLDTATGAMVAYRPEDGLQRVTPEANAFTSGPGGLFYLGGPGGYNRFDPLRLKRNPHPPPMAISSLEVLQGRTRHFLEDGAQLVLSHDRNSFSIEMAALDYADPARNRYSYRMEGLGRAWISRDTERTADFTGLSPGKYTFRARGANNDGIWNDAELRLEIRIEPPFWQAPWFLVLVAAVLVLAVQRAFAFQRGRLLARQRAAVMASELNRKTEELEVARALQLSMLPPRRYSDGDIEVIGMTRTASEVGGDYFDYFRVEDGRLCVLLGDATGHGSAAGLVVGMTKMGAAMWARGCHDGLAGLMDVLNNGLKQSLARNMGMALGVGLLDRIGGKTELAFAGMPPPYRYRAEKGVLEPLVMRCPPLGYLRKLPLVVLDPEPASGDCLIFLTDGFHERFDAHQKIWGREGLEAALSRICREVTDIEEIGHGLFEACDTFAEGRPNEDDMTVLVIRFA